MVLKGFRSENGRKGDELDFLIRFVLVFDGELVSISEQLL